jgi:hypothetical protein
MLAAASLAILLAGAPEATPSFGPGEEIEFEVRFLGVRAGEGKIAVGRAEGGVWPIIFQARTAGVAGLVDIREHLVSYWDAATRLPRGSDLRALEAGDYHVDKARIDRERRQLTIEVTRDGRRTVETRSTSADVQDLVSAFARLRLARLEPGERYEIPVASGSQQFTLVAEVAGREIVEIPAGTFRCVKLRIRTGLQGPFSSKRDAMLWLSDDARHVLVRASAEFAVGGIVATLKSHRPGVPEPAAPGAVASDRAPGAGGR